jgi:hypothetical protein
MKHCSILLVAAIAILLSSGCQAFKRGGRIKSAGTVVQGIPDAGKPATLATSNAGTTVPLAAGSTITVTRIDPVPATPATKDTPAVPAQPAKEVTVIVPSAPTEYHKTETTVKADTGTVDTTIATRKIDAAESRPLLYAAIVAALAAGFFVWASYPTPAIACGIASVVFFMAWKLSGLPDWFYVLGAVAAAVGVSIYLGHNRGLYEPVPTKPNEPAPPQR